MATPNNTTIASARVLKEGESISRSVRLLLTDPGVKKITKKMASMRNSMNQIASRAKEATGSNFRVESGQFITESRDAIILTVVLTCTEDEGEDDI